MDTDAAPITRAATAAAGHPAAGGAARARLLRGLPVTERRLHPAGAATAVLEAGQGPPLVLLHGGIECGGAVWAPLVARLSERHRVVIPDLPGLGASPPADVIGAAAFARWLAELLRLTCEEAPTLVAHSLGGSLAARFAAHHGELLQRLVVYAAPGIGPYRMPVGLRVTAVRFALRPTARNAERFDRRALHDLDRARERDPEWFAAFDAEGRSLARVAHVKRTMRALIAAGTARVPDAELRRIPVPVDLVWGRHDRFVPLRVGEAASARLGLQLHVVEAAGHAAHLDRPQAFDALLNALTGRHA
jgi:2-hydroxymuconate-semialdehyde hydrolase